MDNSKKYPKYSENSRIEPMPRPVEKKVSDIYPELADGAKVPDGPLGLIKLCFAEDFEHWGLYLPEEDVVQRRRGKICKAGWAVWYLFGKDDDGEYLDYYAAHRMTNDSHVRIFEDGRCEGLPAIPDFRISSSDPEEDARLEAESRAESRRVAEILEEKGFGIEGDEPPSVQIRRYQQLEGSEE